MLASLLAVGMIGAVPFLPARSATTGGGGSSATVPETPTQNSGAYATTVDIAVPPYHGLEPTLSLAYSSAGGNDIFGFGWQLAGLSALERTGPDGGAATWTPADVWRLDGEPLVASKTLGGTHVTKRWTPRRITLAADGTATVVEPTGVIRTYARREPFQSQTDGSAIFPRTLLTSMKDPSGNAVSYDYDCLLHQGCYPKTITYNGTTIRFYREARPDSVGYAVGGDFRAIHQRISTIDVTVGAARARAYVLKYTASADTGRSLLTSVLRYGTDAKVSATGVVTGAATIKEVTLTYYSNPNISLESAGKRLAGWCTSPTLMYGDFNADNYPDALCHDFGAGSSSVAFGNGDGSFAAKGVWNPSFCAGARQLVVADVTGDNQDDLVCFNRDNHQIHIAKATKSNTFAPLGTVTVGGNATWCGYANASLAVADINGDGKADLACVWHEAGKPETGSGHKTAMSDGTGVRFTVGDRGDLNRCGMTSSGKPAAAFPWGLGDFNGDGRLDLACQERIKLAVMLGSDDGFFRTALKSEPCKGLTGSKVGYADFNGDGMTDVYCSQPTPGGYALYVALSLGNGLFRAASNWGPSCAEESTGDFDGDGRADLRCNVEGEVRIALSQGVWMGPLRAWANSFKNCESVSVDFNDDGKQDYGCYQNKPGVTTRSLLMAIAGKSLPALHPDLLKTHVNETGGTTTVSYTIPHTRIKYGEHTPNGYHPAAVSSVAVAGSGTIDYAYGEAVWDPLERRFLGYEWVTATDSASGANVMSVFANVPGFATNRVREVIRRNSNNRYLEQIVSEWTEEYGGLRKALVTRQVTARQDGVNPISHMTIKKWTYDSYGNVLTETAMRDAAETADRNVLTETSYRYDTAKFIVDRPATVTTWSLTNPANVKVAKLRQVGYGYDAAGRTTSVTQVSNIATGATVKTTAGYDKYGNLTTSVDEVGRRTTYSYDATYHQYQTGKCSASITPIQCSATGWNTTLAVKTTERDASQQTTTWSYDPLGRVTRVATADGGVATTSYVNWGNPKTQYIQTSVNDGTADGLWSRSYQDGLGRTYKKVSEPDITVDTTYNSQGLVATETAPYRTGQVPQKTVYSYDALGRLIQVVRPGSAVAQTTYLFEKNAADGDFAAPKATVRECDEVKVCRRMAYDSVGNLTSTTEYNWQEQRTVARYDALGNVVSVVDSMGNLTTYTWDALGRKTAMKDPDAGTWSYGYDAAGQLTAQIDPRGVRIDYAYDALGRPTTRKQGAKVLVTNRYDEANHGAGIGRLTSMVDASGSTSWSYDPVGRTTQTVKTIGGVSYRVSEAFDRLGRRARLTYPDGEAVAYAYDASGCLASVGGYAKAATCNAVGQVLNRTLGNGVKQANTYYDGWNWLKQSTATNAAGAQLRNDSYTYRFNGQLASKSSSDAADRWTYSYDLLNRLTKAANTTTAAYTSSFAYDKVGRLTSGTGIAAVVYPAANGGHVHAPSTVGGVAQVYDKAGNRTSDGTTTFGFDALNRMTSSTVRGVTTSYVYDGVGTRVKAGTMVFIELDGQLLYQTNGTTAVKYYYHGGDRVASKDKAGAVSYYVSSPNGSPQLILNSAGAVVRKNIFGPYGNVLNQTGTSTDPFGLAGQYKDATGLYHMGARYLSPKTGTFTSPDPSGAVDIAHPQTLNRYAYSLNDPVNRIDPTGNASVKLFPSVGGNIEYNVDSGQMATTLDLGYVRLNVASPSGGSAGRVEATFGVSIGSIVHGRFGLGWGVDYDQFGPRGIHHVWNYSAGIMDVINESVTYRDTFGMNAARTEIARYHAWTQSERYWMFGVAHDILRTKDVYLGGEIDFGNPFEDPFGGSFHGDPFAGYDLGTMFQFDIAPTNDWWWHGTSDWDLFNDDSWFDAPFDQGWNDSVWTDSYFDSSWDNSPLTGGSFYEFWS